MICQIMQRMNARNTRKYFGQQSYKITITGKTKSAACAAPFCMPANYFASPSGKIILFTKKNTTMETPPLSTVVPMLYSHGATLYQAI